MESELTVARAFYKALQAVEKHRESTRGASGHSNYHRGRRPRALILRPESAGCLLPRPSACQKVFWDKLKGLLQGLGFADGSWGKARWDEEKRCPDCWPGLARRGFRRKFTRILSAKRHDHGAGMRRRHPIDAGSEAHRSGSFVILADKRIPA